MLGLGNLLTKSGVIKKFPNDFSFNFDGSNDYLEIENNPILEPTAEVSVSAWAYMDNWSTASNSRIISNTQGGGYALALDEANDNNISFFVYNGAYLNPNYALSNLSSGWHHICATYKNKTAKLYIDGSLVDTATNTNNTNISYGSNINLFVGGEPDASNNVSAFFNGKIDEVAVYNAELSADDVAKIASKPVDFSKASTYATDRTSNLKLWLRAGDKVLPENDTAIARQDFYTDFDGTDDYVSVPTLFSGGNAYSVSAWVYSSSSRNIINQCNTSGHSNIYIQRVDTNAYRAYLSSNANTTYKYETTNNGVATVAGWDFVTATFNVATNTILIYVNGILQSTTSNSGGTNATTMSTNTNACAIGVRPKTTPDTYWNGKITSVSVHQTILDAQTISQMAKSRFTPMRDNRFSVVDFDGSDDYITLGNVDIYPDDIDAEEFLITAWVNCSVGSDGTIFSKADNSNRAFQLFTNTDDTLSGYVGGTLLNSSTVVADGTWHHVALRSFNDGGTYKGEIYIDGVFKVVGTSGTTTATDRDFLIGARRDSSNTDAGYLLTNSSIASVAIYSEAKDAEFVYAQYQKGITYDESSLSGLVGYWRMGDDTSAVYPTIADSSSNSNDGTITNGASDDIVQQMVAGYDLGAFESSSEELSGELLGDPSFDDASYYTIFLGTGTVDINTTNTGKLTAINAQDKQIIRSNVTENGKLYKATITLDSYTDGSIGGVNNSTGLSFGTLGVGTFTGYFVASGTTLNLRVSGNADFTATDISIKEVLQSEVSDTYPAIIDVNEPVAIEKLTNPADRDFSSDTGNWNDSSPAWSIGSGVATFNNSTGSNQSLIYTGLLTVGKTYLMTGTVTGGSGLQAYLGNNNTGVSFSGSNASVVKEATQADLYLLASDGTSGTLDNISVKELSGNFGTMTNQATSDLVYSSVLPDQSFLGTGVNSAYNFIDLDGTNEYIDAGTGIGNFLGDNYAGDLSLSMWFKADETNVTKGLLSISSFSDSFGDLFIRLASNELQFKLNNAWTITHSFTDTSSWNLLTVVYKSGSESDTKLYINNSSVGSSSGTFPSASDLDFNGLKTVIGGFFSSSYVFNGKIGQVAIWNKELSSTEVSAIYTAGRHSNLLDSYSDNLLGYWAMSALDAKTGLSDVGDGTIYDRSGNSNHGTATNTESADLKSSPNAEPNGYAKGDTNRSTTTP